VVSGVLGAVGAGFKGVGEVEGGAATANAANYAAQVAANNAIIAQRNATYAEEAGQARRPRPRSRVQPR
jgi:hypothetical protein